MISLILLLALFSYGTFGFNVTQEEPCYANIPGPIMDAPEPAEPEVISINCTNVSGKSLDEILRQPMRIKRSYEPISDKRYTFDKMATASQMFIYISGNLTITSKTFPGLTKLEQLYIHDGNLDIEPNALIKSILPSFNEIQLTGVNLADSAIQALDSVTETVTSLTFTNSTPVDKIIKQLAKFKNLRGFGLDNMCTDEPIPESIFKDLAPKLEFISVDSCKTLTNFTASMFHGMSKLFSLKWTNSQIKIEPNAFDGLTGLRYLTLVNDELHSLPDDLFGKNLNLEDVNLEHNYIPNILPSNFTQSKHIRDLRIQTQNGPT
jgi:hypothetical protein